MKILKSNRTLLLPILFLATITTAAQQPATPLPPDQPQLLPGPRPSAATLQQWKDRKLGLFIHFGVYSEFGGMLDGKKIDNGYSEQIMANAPVPMAEYEAAAAKFNPVNFDPDAIVALAKSAGMKFIVITAKHHDGFNMFHTAQTPYNIVDFTPYHKDVVKLMQQACARGGIKFGVYYSSIDWHYPGASSYIVSNSNPIPPAHEAFNVAQLKELATNYGPLSEIWFDMGKPTPAQSERFTRTVHDLQPETLVSGRVFNYQGDFTVMGDNQVPQFVIDEPWQTPASIFGATWGYRSWQQRSDLTGKINENILRLVQVVSRGGNFILNIGPEGDGSVVPYEAEVLKGIGRWMTINSESIYGTSAQPFRQLDFGYATTKGNTLYLFLKQAPANGQLHLPGISNKLVHAYVLGDPKSATLQIKQDATGANISIASMQAAQQRIAAKYGDSANYMPVIAVKFSGDLGKLKVQPPTIAPASDGTITLTAKDADHFLNYNGQGYEAPSTLYKLRWYAAAKPGNYRITLMYMLKSPKGQATVGINGKNIPVDFSKPQSYSLETATLVVAANLTIEAQPYTTIEITPPQPFYKGTPLAADILQLQVIPVK